MRTVLKIVIIVMVTGLLVAPVFAEKSVCSATVSGKDVGSSGNIVSDSVGAVGKTVQTTGEAAVGVVDATGRVITGQPAKTKPQQAK